MKKRNANHDPESRATGHHEAFFYDKDHRPCSKEEAYEIHIHEYDTDGNLLQETIAFCDVDKSGNK